MLSVLPGRPSRLSTRTVWGARKTGAGAGRGGMLFGPFQSFRIDSYLNDCAHAMLFVCLRVFVRVEQGKGDPPGYPARFRMSVYLAKYWSPSSPRLINEVCTNKVSPHFSSRLRH